MTALITAGMAAAKKLAHARIPLKADQSTGGPAGVDEKIAEAVEAGIDTRGRRIVEKRE